MTQPTIQQGAQGPAVRWAQYLLVRRTLSYPQIDAAFAPASNPVLTVDGSYGPHTGTAVKGVQTEAGIASDGVVGLQTWAVPAHAAGQVIADLRGVTPPGG